MQFDQVQIPAVDPPALATWYNTRFGAESTDSADSTTPQMPSVRLGETTLQFEAVEDASPSHLAFRLLADVETAVDWLADRASILPVEGEQYQWFEFLDATAIYFDDSGGNVLEGLCYTGDSHQTTNSEPIVDGITEVGLPAHEPLALVEWLEETVGLSVWGTPSETFAWVGDRHARFVVVPTDRDWYPTDRKTSLRPLSVTVTERSAQPGRHSHPTLPYEISTEQ